MVNKFIRASGIKADATITAESIGMKPQYTQLDRIENKMDRILELLEGQELSTSVVIDGNIVARTVMAKVDELQRVNRRQ